MENYSTNQNVDSVFSILLDESLSANQRKIYQKILASYQKLCIDKEKRKELIQKYKELSALLFGEQSEEYRTPLSPNQQGEEYEILISSPFNKQSETYKSLMSLSANNQGAIYKNLKFLPLDKKSEEYKSLISLPFDQETEEYRGFVSLPVNKKCVNKKGENYRVLASLMFDQESEEYKALASLSSDRRIEEYELLMSLPFDQKGEEYRVLMFLLFDQKKKNDELLYGSSNGVEEQIDFLEALFMVNTYLLDSDLGMYVAESIEDQFKGCKKSEQDRKKIMNHIHFDLQEYFSKYKGDKKKITPEIRVAVELYLLIIQILKNDHEVSLRIKESLLDIVSMEDNQDSNIHIDILDRLRLLYNNKVIDQSLFNISASLVKHYIIYSENDYEDFIMVSEDEPKKNIKRN